MRAIDWVRWKQSGDHYSHSLPQFCYSFMEDSTAQSAAATKEKDKKRATGKEPRCSLQCDIL